MKKTIVIASATIIGIALLMTVLFGLSHTTDGYVCHLCKSLGHGDALRVFGCPVFKTPVTLTHSLTGQECSHVWEWYTASSKGILFNRENWDGPIGTYPYAEEFDKQRAENK